MKYNSKNSFLQALYFLLREIERRGKTEDWRLGEYHPADDPTFPKVLLESNHSKEWFKRALEYDTLETMKLKK